MSPTVSPGTDWQHETLQLRERFDDMLRHMPENLRAGVLIPPTGGFRTPEQQQRLYDDPTAGGPGHVVARPGPNAPHMQGKAADLDFAGPVGPAAREWIRAHSTDYGLGFPLANDPDHMQLVENFDQTKDDVSLLQRTAYRLESNDGKDTRTSPSGAVGPMQIKPETFRKYATPNEDINNPQDNQNVGNRILTEYYKRFGPPAGGDMDKVLIAYKAGEGAVNQPISAETQAYLDKAHKLWNDGAAIDVLNGTKLPPGTSEAQARADALGQERVNQLRAGLDALTARINAADPLSADLQEMMRQHMRHADELQRALEQNIFNPPKQDQTSVLGRFGSLAVLVGIFGGMLSRAPLTASLGAAGAAMEAINQGDYDRYHENFKLWQTQTSMIGKALEMQQTAYSDILQNAQFNDREKWERIQQAATLLNDRDMLLNLEQGNAQAIADRPEKQALTKAKLDEIQGQAEKAHADAAKVREEAGIGQDYGPDFAKGNPEDAVARRIIDAKYGDLVKNIPAGQPVPTKREFADGPAGSDALVEAKQRLGSTTGKGQPHSVQVTWPDGSTESLRGWEGPPGSGSFTTVQGATRDLSGATNVTGLTPSAAMAAGMGPYPYPQDWPGMKEGKPPPGIPENTYLSAITWVQTGKTPALGRSSAEREAINRAVPAAAHALGKNPLEIVEGWAQYGALTAGERSLGTRAAALAIGIGETVQSSAAVIKTAHDVGNTDFPTYNEFANLGSYLVGDPNIVDFRIALNTYLNQYAAAISRTGRMTDQQQRHAYEVLSTNMAEGQIEHGVAQLNLELGYMRNGLQDAVNTVGHLLQPSTATQEAQALPPDVPPGSIEVGNYQGNRVFLTPQGKVQQWVPQ